MPPVYPIQWIRAPYSINSRMHPIPCNAEVHAKLAVAVASIKFVQSNTQIMPDDRLGAEAERVYQEPALDPEAEPIMDADKPAEIR